MAVRAVLHYPSPWLRARAVPVDLDRDDWRTWAADLRDTLAVHPGVGIAAPQIGVLKRLWLIDERRFRTPPPNATLRIWLNPRIVAAAGRQTAREGCLSLPGYLGDTERAKRVTVVGWDVDAQAEREWQAKGFAAVVIQHEQDHLDGILFLDRLINRREALRIRSVCTPDQVPQG